MPITPEFALSPKAKNITGCRFGSLVALRPIAKDGRNIVWEFGCDCGSLYTSVGAWVSSQAKKADNPLAPSCGCLNRQTTRELRLSHGKSNHPLFWVWVAMRERCYTSTHPSYPAYGGKGVYVCVEWLNDAGAFIEWALANGWQQGLHLDKDLKSRVLGLPPHYSPLTCQFISASENSRHTSRWPASNP